MFNPKAWMLHGAWWPKDLPRNLGEKGLYDARWCPTSLAKLVQISPISRVGVLSIVNKYYKLTFTSRLGGTTLCQPKFLDHSGGEQRTRRISKLRHQGKFFYHKRSLSDAIFQWVNHPLPMKHILVGGWAYPSEKWWMSSVGMKWNSQIKSMFQTTKQFIKWCVSFSMYHS